MKAKHLWLAGCAMAGALAVAGAAADEGKAAPDRSAACAREAKGLKGEQYTRAVNECLRADDGDGGLTTQQKKMKTCNAKAREKALHGDERRSFMSACLKG